MTEVTYAGTRAAKSPAARQSPCVAALALRGPWILVTRLGRAAAGGGLPAPRHALGARRGKPLGRRRPRLPPTGHDAAHCKTPMGAGTMSLGTRFEVARVRKSGHAAKPEPGELAELMSSNFASGARPRAAIAASCAGRLTCRPGPPPVAASTRNRTSGGSPGAQEATAPPQN